MAPIRLHSVWLLAARPSPDGQAPRFEKASFATVRELPQASQYPPPRTLLLQCDRQADLPDTALQISVGRLRAGRIGLACGLVFASVSRRDTESTSRKASLSTRDRRTSTTGWRW